jgi:predicted enzyme related to lactoylglutathione lyase
MRKVLGIGGVFFRTPDRAALMEWYREHLGIDSEEWGAVFRWGGTPASDGYTVWSPFGNESEHLGEPGQDFMINYRVADLAALVAELTTSGVRVVGPIEDHPNGRFAWIEDLEGRRVELWEPVPVEDDPYV